MNGSSNHKKLKTVLILAAILVMPGFLYYLLQDQGKNRYRPLPFFGPKTVATTFRSVRGVKVPDTIYHTIKPFSLLNQANDTVSLSSLKGKISIISLFYAKSGSDGLKSSMKVMKGFSKMYSGNPIVHLASISVDPAENFNSIKAFAEVEGAVPSKWDFLRGDAAQLEALIQPSLLLDALNTSTAKQHSFTYSNKIVLLDSKQRIRGFYEATNNEEASKLDDEIKVLIAEELRNLKDGR